MTETDIKHLEEIVDSDHEMIELLKKEIQYSSGGLIGTNRGEIDNLLRRDGFNW